MPPEATQFKKGDEWNGNAGGRPKGRSITSRLRDVLEMAELGGKPLPGGKQVADLVVEALVKQVLKGNPQCISMLLERADGKVLQALEVTTKEAPKYIDRAHNRRDKELEHSNGSTSTNGNGVAS